MSVLPAIRFLSSTPMVERLAWTLIHSLWEFALIAVLALTIARAARRSAATTRYAILVAGMFLATLAPVATWLLQPTFAPEPSPSASVLAAGSLVSADRATDYANERRSISPGPYSTNGPHSTGSARKCPRGRRLRRPCLLR